MSVPRGEVEHVALVERPLQLGHPQQTHVLLLLGQRRLQDGVAAPLHQALQQGVQHVRAEPHQADVGGCRVHALAVRDRTLEHVVKLGLGAEEVGSHEVDHAPVLDQTVLQGVAGQRQTAARPDALQSLRDAGTGVLDAVALVTNDQVRSGPGDGRLDPLQKLFLPRLRLQVVRPILALLLSRGAGRGDVEQAVELVADQEHAAVSVPVPDHLGSRVQRAVRVVQHADGEVSRPDLAALCQRGVGVGVRQPEVELVQPVLDGVDGYDDEHGAVAGVAQEDVGEGDRLHGLAEAHRVRQDAAEAGRRLTALLGLDQIVVQEADAADLKHDRCTGQAYSRLRRTAMNVTRNKQHIQRDLTNSNNLQCVQ